MEWCSSQEEWHKRGKETGKQGTLKQSDWLDQKIADHMEQEVRSKRWSLQPHPKGPFYGKPKNFSLFCKVVACGLSLMVLKLA